MEWLPIDTAPENSRKMFVVVGIGVDIGNVSGCITDPYFVWSKNGEFIRWPHYFSPTHWVPLPELQKGE